MICLLCLLSSSRDMQGWLDRPFGSYLRTSIGFQMKRIDYLGSNLSVSICNDYLSLSLATQTPSQSQLSLYQYFQRCPRDYCCLFSALVICIRREYYPVLNHYKRCHSRAASQVCSPKRDPNERCLHLIYFPFSNRVTLVSSYRSVALHSNKSGLNFSFRHNFFRI